MSITTTGNPTLELAFAESRLEQDREAEDVQVELGVVLFASSLVTSGDLLEMYVELHQDATTDILSDPEMMQQIRAPGDEMSGDEMRRRYRR